MVPLILGKPPIWVFIRVGARFQSLGVHSSFLNMMLSFRYSKPSTINPLKVSLPVFQGKVGLRVEVVDEVCGFGSRF